jgi:protein phosphatase PTC7
MLVSTISPRLHRFPGSQLLRRSAEGARFGRLLEARRRGRESQAARQLQKLFRVFILKVRVHKLFIRATDIKRNLSATTIQKHSRRVLARKEAAFRRVVYGVQSIRLHAIKSIQRMLRAKLLTKRVSYYALCFHIYQTRNSAIVAIQKVLKGAIVRKDMHFLKYLPKVVKWPHKAKRVTVVSNFTRKPWKEELTMNYSKYARVHWCDYLVKHFVAPGIYHFKFNVDGVLTCDHDLPVVQDQFGTFSNILDLGRKFPLIGSVDKLLSIDQFQQHMRQKTDRGEGIMRSFSLESSKLMGMVSDDSTRPELRHEVKSEVMPELRLELGSCMAAHPKNKMLPLSPEGSADALFIDMHEQTFGLADGVGEWERHGIDASRFSNELIKRAQALMARNLTRMTAEIQVESFLSSSLSSAYDQTCSIGSSTVLLALCSFSRLFTLILGDSCILVLRKRVGEETKLIRVFRSKEQQHFFNCPFQLVRLPSPDEYDNLRAQGFGNFVKFLEKEKSANITKFDTPQNAQFFSIVLKPGDIVIAASDGLYDNVFDGEIKKLALELDEAGLSPSDFCSQLSHTLVHLAIERGFDSSYLSPFAKAAKRAKRSFIGGKLDDTSVIVGKVVSL